VTYLGCAIQLRLRRSPLLVRVRGLSRAAQVRSDSGSLRPDCCLQQPAGSSSSSSDRFVWLRQLAARRLIPPALPALAGAIRLHAPSCRLPCSRIRAPADSPGRSGRPRDDRRDTLFQPNCWLALGTPCGSARGPHAGAPDVSSCRRGTSWPGCWWWRSRTAGRRSSAQQQQAALQQQEAALQQQDAELNPSCAGGRSPSPEGDDADRERRIT
jgi:hypothetical protein